MPSSTDRCFRSVYKMHIWLLLWHEHVPVSCPENSHNVTTHHQPPPAPDVQEKQGMTERGMEPCPTLVLIQSTDSELAKGGFSHIPDLLKHSPMLDTPKPTPQEYPHHAGSRAQGGTPGQTFAWRTITACEPCPSTQRDASTALTTQHVLLMFRCANQPADSFNTLAL